MLRQANFLRRTARKLAGHASALKSDQRGASAIEFSFFVGVLSFAMLNVADISIYIYKRMEVENAAQMANQEVFSKCGQLTDLPVTKNCAAFSTAINTGLQSTSLGANVTLASGSPAEGYYCLNQSGALIYVSGVNSKPADCSATSMPTLQPGDYLSTTARYTYAPLFPGVTVASAFATPISKTSIIRLQ
jgi:Flp pilus assembly protein TadG